MFQKEKAERLRIKQLRTLTQQLSRGGQQSQIPLVEEPIEPIPAPFSIYCNSTEGTVMKMSSIEFVRKVLKAEATYKTCL